MDAARSSVRLGAQKVTVSLQAPYADMTALKEIEEPLLRE